MKRVHCIFWWTTMMGSKLGPDGEEMMSEEDALRVYGEPTTKVGNIWHYE